MIIIQPWSIICESNSQDGAVYRPQKSPSEIVKQLGYSQLAQNICQYSAISIISRGQQDGVNKGIISGKKEEKVFESNSENDNLYFYKEYVCINLKNHKGW